MSDAPDWTAVGISIVVAGSSTWQWLQARNGVRQLARQEVINAARQAVDRVISRWRVSSLGTLNLATDPNIPDVAASAKRWRDAAAADLAYVAAPSRNRKTRPYKLIEQAAQTLQDFEAVIDPIVLLWTPDMIRLYNEDAQWKEHLQTALEAMQKQMKSTIDSLELVPEKEYGGPDQAQQSG